MEQKKINKTILVLIVVSIIATIATTAILLNATNFSGEEPIEQESQSTGEVRLNIGDSEPEEYTSSGTIHLDITN